MSENQPTVRRWIFVVTILVGGAIGIVWNVLIGAILFRGYSFFESVVICLLVMILSSVGILRADFETGGSLYRPEDMKDRDPTVTRKESDILRELRALLKTVFYGISFVMSLIKLVLALIGR